MHHPAEHHVSGVDTARIEAVAQALGPRRLGELLALLETRLGQIAAAIESLPDGAATLVAALHQSRGSAISLGLIALAEVLADIEAQVADAILPPASDAIRDPGALASVKDAAHALQGIWHAAAEAIRRHVPDIGFDQAPGICIR